MPVSVIHAICTYQDIDAPGTLTGRRRVLERATLCARLVHPITGFKHPQRFTATIDTGATRTIIPYSALADFRERSPAALVEGLPGQFTLADGSRVPNVPAVEVAFEFEGYATGDMHTGPGHKHAEPVPMHGRRPDGTRRSFRCYALEHPEVHRNQHEEPIRFNRVIIGLDLLSTWDVRLNGPAGVFTIAIDPDLV
ncbi:MAG: hypothetical protein ACKVS8_02630 [Phycisphaerales bacterium]